LSIIKPTCPSCAEFYHNTWDAGEEGKALPLMKPDTLRATKFRLSGPFLSVWEH